jgi:hypothetical protein
MERRIKELEADLVKKAGKAKFTEPSAAERASKPVTPQLGWRDARKARKLREPVPQPPPTPPPWRASPPSAPAKSTRRRARSLLIAAAYRTTKKLFIAANLRDQGARHDARHDRHER